MVLESIVNPLTEEYKPTRMFHVGFLYSTLGLFLGYFIFGTYASLAGIFLTSIPLIIVIYNAIKLEERETVFKLASTELIHMYRLDEREDVPFHKDTFLIKEHGRTLAFFMYLFLGLVTSYCLWFIVLPPNLVNTVFETQMDTIRSINPDISGFMTQRHSPLMVIILNNLRVLFFCIVFSLLYGAGAILILIWNASVIGAAVGSIIRNAIMTYAGESHSTFLYNYFKSFPVGFSYAIHGIPEIAAYFMGALAGGIISFAVVNHEYKTKEFKHIIIDSADLVVLSVLLIVLAAFLEVYISPLVG